MIADVENTQSLEKYIKNLKNYLDDKWGDDVDVIYINNVDFGQKSEFELKYSFVADVIVVDKVHKEVIELYKYNLPSMIRYGKGENHIVCKDTDIIKTEIIDLYRKNADIPKTIALFFMTLIGDDGVQLELITKQDIDSLSSFVFAVKSIQTGSLCRSFYRGQEKSSYYLSPSVCRKDSDNEKCLKNEKYIKQEKKMINEAIINRPFDFPNSMTMFDILVKMQHYSYPTRLLDITLNYLVALYFAVQIDKGKDENGKVFVFLINKQKIIYSSEERLDKFIRDEIEESIEPNDIALDQVYCVLPKLDNERIVAQKGAFLLYGIKDLDNKCVLNPYTNISITIKKEYKSKILEELNDISINKSTLFPSIETTLIDMKNNIDKY